MFHHIYIEITNVCQFQCSFCPKTSRAPRFMTPPQFEQVVLKIKHHTKLIYLHVLGEPLIHPQLDEILGIAHKHGLQVNITTNGYDIAKAAPILLAHHHIKKINISLHSMEDSGQKEKDIHQYMQDVYEFANKATTQIPATIVYRLWNTNKEYDIMTAFLQNMYHPDEMITHQETSPNWQRLAYRVFLHKQKQFEWPIQATARIDDHKNPCVINQTSGYCLGLKTHIAVLSDGTVVPCCLDGEGQLRLGNIFESTLDEILQTKRAITMRQGFQRHVAVERLCQACTYKDRFTLND